MMCFSLPIAKNVFYACCRLAALVALCSALPTPGAVIFPGKAPGGPDIIEGATALALSNNVLKITWKLEDDKLHSGQLTDKISGQAVDLGESLFQIVLEDRRVIDATKMKLARPPRPEQTGFDPVAACAGTHFPGQRFEAVMTDPESGLEVTWRATLREGANYVRQEFDLAPKSQDLSIKEIILIDMQMPGGRLSGPATGSPVVRNTLFAGIEDPMFQGTVEGGRTQASLKVGVPIRKGQHYVRSTVLGVAPEGQLRRRAVMRWTQARFPMAIPAHMPIMSKS